jgi:hypothetical protein
MLANLQKTSVQKYGNKQKAPQQPQAPQEEVHNDTDELLDMLDLHEQVKPKAKKEETPAEDAKDDNDPLEDVYKNF